MLHIPKNIDQDQKHRSTTGNNKMNTEIFTAKAAKESPDPFLSRYSR